MWRKLSRRHPCLYEAVNWGTVVVSAGALILALEMRFG